jgi:sRNA-binding carbon storage regulator CsrA
VGDRVTIGEDVTLEVLRVHRSTKQFRVRIEAPKGKKIVHIPAPKETTDGD